MVRAGRRVRTLVASAKGSDNCDSPKRKDQRLDFSAKLSNDFISTRNKTITDFFQVVEVLEDKTEIEIIEVQPNVPSRNLEEFQKLEQGNNHLNNSENDNKTVTTTPHRIQLNLDQQSSPTSALSQLQIVTSKKGAATKARRRLNVTSTANQILKATTKDEPTSKNAANSHTITEFFPVRRSVRKTKKTVLEEKQRTLEQCIISTVEKGLEITYFADKGRGIIASQNFSKGDFVVEYRGDLIDTTEAKNREQKYADEQNTGCYMYYFKHKDVQYCIDATAESGYLGRLVNHCRNGNLMTKSIMVAGKPRLVLLAKDDINEGEELTYDYGDRSKESLLHHPWLAS